MEAAWVGRRLERILIAVEGVLSSLDFGTMASEDLCGEDGHSSGRLSEAS